jgi:hypothetical protein
MAAVDASASRRTPAFDAASRAFDVALDAAIAGAASEPTRTVFLPADLPDLAERLRFHRGHDDHIVLVFGDGERVVFPALHPAAPVEATSSEDQLGSHRDQD